MTNTEITEHIATRVCKCKYCTMIDVMMGDPELNEWEHQLNPTPFS